MVTLVTKKIKNKSVKKQSLPNPTKWASKDAGLVKTESEQQPCAGEEYVTGNTNGIGVNIHIKEEQTEWELSEKSADESGSNLTKELLSDSACPQIGRASCRERVSSPV